MTKQAIVDDQKVPAAEPTPDTDYEKLHIGREFLNVTWRMATPVVIFAGLGLWADRSWGSQPWMTLLGTMAGFLFAAILVKRQIGDLPEDEEAGMKEDHDK
jgi:F0F1-type ATP synthase assembly protein I